MTERYIWSAVYDDGTELEEYPSPDHHRSFREVDKSRVKHLRLRPNEYLGVAGEELIVDLTEDELPVMIRRVALDLTSGTRQVCHVVGKRRLNCEELYYVLDSTGETELVRHVDEDE